MEPPPSPRVEYLADHPRHVPTVAAWLHAEWGHLQPGSTPRHRAEELRRQMQRDAIPLAVVALHADRAVGFAALVDHQPADLPPAVPRLANVYVEPAHRRRGLGSRLALRIADEARRLGAPRLFLYAKDQEALYARLGWRTVMQSRVPDWGETSVMVLDLA